LPQGFSLSKNHNSRQQYETLRHFLPSKTCT
jgi:hypothetical protein